MQKIFYLLLSVLVSSVFIYCGNADQVNAATNLATAPVNESNVNPTGLIAYTRNDEEIRVIDSAGGNDKQLWTHPDAKEPFGIFDLAWRPDGKELAFSSGHENIVSLYHADLYGIRPDGSGLRKITNTPAYNNLKDYKKGTVTITLKNLQYSFQTAQSSTGIFTVYVIGAEMPQQILLAPGATKTIVFNNVADFGDHAQPVVAMYGQIRWIMPGTDVVAGKNTKAPDFLISGDGYEYFGAFRPVWKADGSQISYRDGMCVVKTIPAKPGIGVQFNSLFGKNGPTGSCYWDRGPTQSLSDKVLYYVDASEESSGFYMRQEGETSKSPEPLYMTPDGAYDVKWLPDGSGFLYSKNYYREDYKRVCNIFHYDIASKKHVPVTNLEDGYAREFSISPSGKWVVYEKCQIDQDRPDDLDFISSDLWIISTDGTGDRLLVKNGMSPSWSR